MVHDIQGTSLLRSLWHMTYKVPLIKVTVVHDIHVTSQLKVTVVHDIPGTSLLKSLWYMIYNVPLYKRSLWYMTYKIPLY